MPIKCKSEQINTEHYHYTLAAGLNFLFPVKARPGEVLIVCGVWVYNPGQDAFGVCYRLLRQRGDIIYLNSGAAVAAGRCQVWEYPYYLRDHEEMGVGLTPNAAGDIAQVTFLIIRLKDSEWVVPT